MSAAKLLTMSEAADALQLEQRDNVAQWMRRRLRRREAELGMKILSRDGRELKVSMHKLRLAFPERFEPAEVASKDSRRRQGKIIARLMSIEDRLDSLEGSAGALIEATRQLKHAIKAR
jgi:IS5 family transposase